MYEILDKYLYEILEDYKDDPDSRDDIFRAFCDGLWEQAPFRLVQKKIRFKVSRRLQSSEIGKLFLEWTAVAYTSYEPLTAQINYLSFIRQKINNIYLFMFHPDVVIQKDYMDLLKTPKALYYRWKNGENFSPGDLKAAINKAMEDAARLKDELSRRKIPLPFDQYQNIIEQYLRRCFVNCRSLEETKDWSEMQTLNSVWCEDAYLVRYICRSLNGYLKNYQKKYFHLYNPGSKDNIVFSYCSDCNVLFRKKSNNQKRCKSCQLLKNRSDTRNRVRRHRNVTKLKNA